MCLKKAMDRLGPKDIIDLLPQPGLPHVRRPVGMRDEFKHMQHLSCGIGQEPRLFDPTEIRDLRRETRRGQIQCTYTSCC